MTDPFSLAGKRVVIVGATAGIGYAVADHFVKQEADVVISGRRENGDDLAAAIGAKFVRTDVISDESVQTGMDRAAELLGGGIDVLILNAGTAGNHGSLPDLDLAEWRRVIDINLHGPVRGVKFALPHMGRGGVIIATSSPGGRQATAGGMMMAYSCSKAGLDMFVQSAGLHLAGMGIRVSGLLPGLIRTEIAGADGFEEEPWLAALTSTGTSRPPSDLVTAYQFLASDAAHMLQGAIIAADDGCSAGLSMPVLSRLMGLPATD